MGGSQNRRMSRLSSVGREGGGGSEGEEEGDVMLEKERSRRRRDGGQRKEGEEEFFELESISLPFSSLATSTRSRPLFLLSGTKMNSYVCPFLFSASHTKLISLSSSTACPLSLSSSPADVRGRSRSSSPELLLLFFPGYLPFNLCSIRSRNFLTLLSFFLQTASFSRLDGGPFRSSRSAVASDLDLKGTVHRLGARRKRKEEGFPRRARRQGQSEIYPAYLRPSS